MGLDMTLVGPLVVPAGDVDDLELVTGSAALAGRVLDGRDRAPVGEAILILERTDVAGRQRVFAGKTLTDADGAWRFDGLVPGTYRASAYSLDENLGEERLEDLTLIARQERAGLELVLWPGAELEVRVRDADGRPVTGARVGFEDALGRAVQFGIDDRTDSHGALRVRGLRPERWTIRVRHDGLRAEAILVVRLDQTNAVVLDLR
jgi:protocatechuate 3,4-dioxygenase beta subunit